jgi:heptosyltransferase-3
MLFSSSSKKPRRILVARGDALGDMVLATVVIRPLRAMFPGAEIYFLARKEMVPLLRGIPDVSGVIENNLAYKWKWSELPVFFALCREIRAVSPDIFLGLWEKRRYAFLSWLAGVPLRIGYAVSFLNRLFYTHVVPIDFSFFFKHQAFYNLDLLQPLSSLAAIRSDCSPYIGCPDAWVSSIRDRYPRLSAPYVCVQVDGSAHQKTWLPETCLAIVRYLSLRHSCVVLLGWPDSERRAILDAGVVDLSNVIDLTYQLSLPDVAVVLSGSELFVGLDSGLAHLSGAFNVPSVVYFLNRTQNALRWAPLGQFVHLVFSRHHCPDRCVPSVCFKTTCRDMLLYSDMVLAIDHAVARNQTSPTSRLAQLRVCVISHNGAVFVDFFAAMGVSVCVVSPSMGILEMSRYLSDANVMWVLLDNVTYGLSHRIVRVLVSNQVMWPPFFMPVTSVSDVVSFLDAQGFSASHFK